MAFRKSDVSLSIKTFEKSSFEHNFASGWKKLPRCPECREEFHSNGGNRNTNKRGRPLLLNCMHVVCESCIFTTRESNYKCRVCNQTTKFDRRRPIREQTEFHFYLTGLLSYINHNLQQDLAYLAQNRPSEEKRVTGYECSECNIAATQSFCVQCNVLYCMGCFNNVHRLGKALQKHSLTIIGSTKSSLSIQNKEKCKRHFRYITHNCLNCNKDYCFGCIEEFHQNHNFVNILEENSKQIFKIHSLIETVKQAMECNKQAQKDTLFIRKKKEGYALDAIDQVSNYFILKHGELQLAERKILMNIKGFAIESLQETKNAEETLKKSYDNFDEIQSTLTQFAANIPKNVSMQLLVERANSLLETTPCNVEFEGISQSPFKFSENKIFKLNELCNIKYEPENFETKIRTFFGDTSFNVINETKVAEKLSSKMEKLQLPSELKKRISSGNTFVQNTENNSKLPVCVSDVMQSRVQHTGTDEENAQASYQRKNNKTMPENQKLLQNSQLVHVCHLKSPERFYVHSSKEDNQKYFELCSKEANSIIGSATYIEVEKLYLVLDSINKTWYRGMVTSTANNDMYKVLLIDLGESILVPKQRFKDIPDELRLQPALAVECSLFGIKPKARKWTDAATQLMAEIINNQPVKMVVLERRSVPMLVDLLTSSLKHTISIRDTLIYADLGQKINVKDPEILQEIEKLSAYKKNALFTNAQRFYKNIFKEKDTFCVTVISVTTPHEFYVSKSEYIKAVTELYLEMHQHYDNGHHEKIYMPQVNMVCAVYIEDDWYRAKITNVMAKGNCSVFLVDNGQTVHVSWKQLRVLAEQFLRVNEAALHCSLLDIEPLQENAYKWTKKAIEEFKRLTKAPTLNMTIHQSKDFHYKVSLIAIGETCDLNINALLVDKKFAISTGPESLILEFPKVCHLEYANESLFGENKIIASAKSVRTAIQITHIVSPGEFYAVLQKNLKGVKLMHQELRNAQENKKTMKKLSKLWTVGESCVVYAVLRIDEPGAWYRGQIVEVKESTDGHFYSVYIRDVGKTLKTITAENLDLIDEKLDKVRSAAIQCHLACVQPTGGQKNYAGTSVDEFRELASSFESLGATLQGSKRGKSLPVIVWGLTTQLPDALSPLVQKWKSINKLLANKGLVHLVEKFQTPDAESIMDTELADIGSESFGNWMKNFDKNIGLKKEPKDLDLGSTIVDDVVDNNDKTQISAWLPALPICKTIFTGIPTYVDVNAHIYLHDADQSPVLNRIKSTINKNLADLPPEMGIVTWQPGQPCLAKYHLDKMYYRAEIVSVKPYDILSVKFVDYGNIEDCPASDLRKEIKLGDIPIQASRFIIEGISPKGGGRRWTRKVLDYLHSKLVDKFCSVRVSLNQEGKDIKTCMIKCDGVDIIQNLLQNSMTEEATRPYYRQLNMFSKSLHNMDSFEESIESDNGTTFFNADEEIRLKKKADLIEQAKANAKPSLDNYKELIINDVIEKLCTSFAEQENDENDSDADIVELEYTYHSGVCNNDQAKEFKFQSISSDSSSFNPKETSSVKSADSAGRNDDVFPVASFSKLTGFYCEVAYIKSALSVFIYPFIGRHQQQSQELFQKVQIEAKIAQGLKQFKTNTPCLAFYKKDQKWYRGLIRAFSIDSQTVDVVYVDFMNAETLPVALVKSCPQQLLLTPLRNIQVKLHGLLLNPRLRESDVQRRLTEILANNKLYCKIIRHDRVPEVELFTSQTEANLVYQNMITDKYYLLQKM